jgi:hypothetical protein
VQTVSRKQGLSPRPSSTKKNLQQKGWGCAREKTKEGLKIKKGVGWVLNPGPLCEETKTLTLRLK